MIAQQAFLEEAGMRRQEVAFIKDTKHYIEKYIVAYSFPCLTASVIVLAK